MPAKPKHRQNIIDTCVVLFRRRGYSGTGLNDIVEESGAPKGSLYHYFPSGKPSIAVAAVEEAGNRVASTLKSLSEECASAGDLIMAHAQLLAGWMKQSRYRDGCPITTVLLEMAPADRHIAEAGRSAYAIRISILTDKLVTDGVPRERAGRLAILCTSAIQGSLIQARVERSSTAILTAAEELAKLLVSAVAE